MIFFPCPQEFLRSGAGTAVYNSAISAIAGGATRLNDIASKIGEERSKTIKYLDTLINLGILYKEYPFGEDPSKSRKGIYRIKDNCYRFWYRYVFLNKTVIEQGAGKTFFTSIKNDLNSFIGFPFEQVCLQYLTRQNNKGKLPFVFTKSGRWWGPNPETKQTEEIDLVLGDPSGKRLILAECKWRNELKDTAALNQLLEKAKLFPNYSDISFYLFSKKHFSKVCQRQAVETGKVTLVEIDEIMRN
jgi:AAA+ ATPase superfamily predicted ATPase